MESESAVITNGVIALATAILALIAAFGVDLSDAQVAAILGVLAATMALGGLFIRNHVFSQKTVTGLLQDGNEAAGGTDGNE